MKRLQNPLKRTSRLLAIAVIAVLALGLLPVAPAQPVLAASGEISVSFFFCPDGYNADGEDFGDIAAACTTAGAGVEFSMQPTGAAAQNSATGVAGVVSWPSSDPGDGVVSWVNPGAYASSVWCSVQESGELGLIQPKTVDLPASIAYDIPDDQQMSCSWFAYQATATLIGSEIRLQKWVCPDGYDASLTPSIDLLWTDCTTPGAGFPFTRVPVGDDPVEMSADAGGAITWPEFPSGTGFVAEMAAEMPYSRVFCTDYTIGEIGLAVYNEVDATGNQIDYDLAPTEGIDCEWFNYAPPGETSDLILYKRACPEGDWSTATLAELSLDCVDVQPDVTFTVIGPSSSVEGVTDPTGAVGWSLPSDATYTVVESAPDGYGASRVFCSYYDQLVGPGEFEAVDAPGNEITQHLEAGWSMECYWFNLPVELGTIVVDKYACPVGYGIGTGYDQLAANCTSPVTGVTFTLTPAGLPPIDGQTDNSGRVVFENVPLGEGSLDEQVPSQFNYVEVFCAISDDVAAGPYQAQNITAQNVMGYLMEPSQVWSCSWFNLTLEAGPASLTINKYTCQPLHDPVEPLQTLANECAEPNDDVTFTLEAVDLPEGASAGMGASTGPQPGPASVEFADLEAGRYVLTEEIPDSIRLAYISECRSDQRAFASPLYPFAFVAPDGRFQIELLPGENVECDWYNILDESPGTITITKFWCQGDVINEASCPIYDGGAVFTLIPAEGGTPIPAVTGADGTVTVEATGTFEVLEEDFEWCSAQSDAANADGLIEVGPGDEVSVEIYNCGLQPVQ
ncbi:MAG: hypothetical protein KF883_00305 [Thermomicrobiales bacterium]|nr:hypothetical protein [Thermomicrobiales bacterium]